MAIIIFEDLSVLRTWTISAFEGEPNGCNSMTSRMYHSFHDRRFVMHSEVIIDMQETLV